MTEHIAARCFRQCVKSVVSRHAEKHKSVSNRQPATHITDLLQIGSWQSRESVAGSTELKAKPHHAFQFAAWLCDYIHNVQHSTSSDFSAVGRKHIAEFRRHSISAGGKHASDQSAQRGEKLDWKKVMSLRNYGMSCANVTLLSSLQGPKAQ